jgi:hypothetical protein
MIELRWALQHRGYIEKERVLQYRILEQQINIATESYYMGWSEWKDVPEVDVPNTPSAAQQPTSEGK